MSRITKYLKQKASLARMQRDPETLQPMLDSYGEPIYLTATTEACRREKVVRDVFTATGAAVRSDTRYYFDETLFIDVGDKVDGKMVVGVEEYTGNMGAVEGYLVYIA